MVFLWFSHEMHSFLCFSHGFHPLLPVCRLAVGSVGPVGPVGPAEGGPPARQWIEAGQQPGDGPKPLGGNPMGWGTMEQDGLGKTWILRLGKSHGDFSRKWWIYHGKTHGKIGLNGG